MRLPVYERALYGVLTGYLPAVLPVCRTWEDHLWARLTCRIESRCVSRLFCRLPPLSLIFPLLRALQG